MRHIVKLSLVSSLAFNATLTARAAGGDQVYAGLTLTQTDATSTTSSNNGTQSKSRSVATLYSAMLGYRLSAGLMLGAKYWNATITSGNNGDTEVTTDGMGPMLGFLHESGIMVSAAYLMDAKKVVDSNLDALDATYSGGDGTIVTAGVVKVFNNAWGAGLLVEQSSVNYKKLKVGTAEEISLTGTWKDELMTPYLAFMVFF